MTYYKYIYIYIYIYTAYKSVFNLGSDVNSHPAGTGKLGWAWWQAPEPPIHDIKYSSHSMVEM